MRYQKRNMGLVLVLVLTAIVSLIQPMDASAAGVSTYLMNQQAKSTGTLSGVSVLLAQHMTAEADVDATEVEVETPEVAEPSLWANRLMTTVSDEMNIREDATETSAIVGYLRSGDVAEIVAEAGDWYQIVSGEVTGFVNAAYVVTGEEAEALANSLVPTTATVNADGLRIRTEASAESTIATTAYTGEKLVVLSDVTAPEGWVAVEDGFVVAEYVTVEQSFTTALSQADREAEIAAQKAAEEAAAAEAAAQAEQAAAAVRQAEAVYASTDELTLLAAIIQLEGGNQPYEGQVAIGSVVMNRVRSPRWPNTISEVIFQSGQFYPASSTRLLTTIQNGPKASCMQAAQDAINGVDMVGGCMSFRPVSSGRQGLVIGGHVFF